MKCNICKYSFIKYSFDNPKNFFPDDFCLESKCDRYWSGNPLTIQLRLNWYDVNTGIRVDALHDYFFKEKRKLK